MKRKFNQPSKVVGVRVPTTKVGDFKRRIKPILDSYSPEKLSAEHSAKIKAGLLRSLRKSGIRHADKS